MTRRRKRSVAERIAETEAWYRGAPARNAPGPLPGEAFIQSLPEGATIELRDLSAFPTFTVHHVAPARGLRPVGAGRWTGSEPVVQNIPRKDPAK